MKLRSATLFALGFAGALLLAGCGRPFVPATPPGFVELEDLYEENEYRAATADGVVLGIRVLENEPKGETAFWVRAI
ncbi:MAG: serine/threonine protein kinase, partial [Polyangiaceae bacterium]|nr:serine/threonine protein kinase [Polyangiaceae bacterium]